MRLTCEVCKHLLERRGWRGSVALFACTNPYCPDYGNHVYTAIEVQSSEHVPDGKEGSE